MSRWVFEGLRTPKPTTRYPAAPETAPGISPGLPHPIPADATAARDQVASSCPTGALQPDADALAFAAGRCVHCMRCVRGELPGVGWAPGFAWAHDVPRPDGTPVPLPAALRASLHVRVIDAGACGACMSEMSLLVAPHYNMHRLGMFITPTPRKADVLLVAGPVTSHMRGPLRETYASMPEPKRVIAVGACAVSGGVFGPSFASAGGAADCVPVDIVVPGCPPPPLAILDALLRVTDRTRAPAANDGSR